MRIIKNLKDSLFNENLGLDRIIINYLLISLGLFTFIGGIINYIFGLHEIQILVPILDPLFLFIVVYFSKNSIHWKKIYLVALIVQGYGYNILLWHATEGINGSAVFTFIMFGIAIVLFTKGSNRIFNALLYLIFYSLLFILQYIYPEIVLKYPSRKANFYDMWVGITIAYFFFIMLMIFIKREYQKNIDRNLELLTDLEVKNSDLESTKKELKELVIKLEESSSRDVLTGVHNRGYLLSETEKLIKYSNKTGKPLTLVMIDIDFFKKVNDNYGHIYGDKVLITTAKTILECLESNEVFGRFGGEEFLIVFPRTDLDEAIKKCKVFHEKIQNLNWDLENFKVTVSCGIALYKKNQTFEEFVNVADDNLYKAKQNGRNRIEY